MNVKIITSKDRVYWDLYIFFIISIAAFEIPYELLIGIGDSTIQRSFDYLFLISFGIDMVLNCITEQSVSSKGILGVRRLFPENYLHLSDQAEIDLHDPVARQFPATMIAYITSWWFVVDLLAIFPFELVFGAYSGLNMSRTLRLIRMPRMLRAIRVIRAVKAAKAISSLDNAFQLNPSLGRLVLLGVSVPWMMHLFACLITYFENETGGMLYTHNQSMAMIFETFLSGSIIEAGTMGGTVCSYLSVLTGYIFFGVFMGNFASFFTHVDGQKELLEEKVRQWKSAFKSNPRVFPKGLQKEILTYEKNALQREKSRHMDSLITNIDDADLRRKVLGLVEDKYQEI